jgi:lysophospholipid acyltransferase (LPLAT)-like uncharacterized protein
VFKSILRSQFVLRLAGHLMAGYLRLVQRTNRFVTEPADVAGEVYEKLPMIIAMWHGQHFMIPFAKRPQDPFAVMISRHGDGEINAVAVEAFGIKAVRGSGAQRQDQVRKRGGAQALRQALATLRDNVSLSMTADVPKVSRVAGKGIIVLAQLSGRPILPIAVVTSRRIDLKSWDRTSIGLPFGRGAMVFGKPIHVAPDMQPAELASKRLELQDALDAVHARAYALVGSRDPGADRAEVLQGRAAALLADKGGVAV